MTEEERREHYRVEDRVFFDYYIIETNKPFSDLEIQKKLLGEKGNEYFETTRYFNDLEQNMSDLSNSIAKENPAISQYLRLLNTKIDHLARKLLTHEQTKTQIVSLSLGGVSFETKEEIADKTHIKMLIYTKPNMVPLIVDGSAIYSEMIENNQFRTAVQFTDISHEQECLLSRHIMHVQIRCRAI